MTTTCSTMRSHLAQSAPGSDGLSCFQFVQWCAVRRAPAKLIAQLHRSPSFRHLCIHAGNLHKVSAVKTVQLRRTIGTSMICGGSCIPGTCFGIVCTRVSSSGRNHRRLSFLRTSVNSFPDTFSSSVSQWNQTGFLGALARSCLFPLSTQPYGLPHPQFDALSRAAPIPATSSGCSGLTAHQGTTQQPLAGAFLRQSGHSPRGLSTRHSTQRRWAGSLN